ncbi:MAG TPA: hypothetical protein DHW82_05865 [Spirochaetia bacterium]|nr:MAG: hypothetical protein A2Y41_04875 [Spirochaetes bacterium GWB1_36_13]HCL56519.1 hypothetical protein [Spirochaetia bacterium]
MTYSQTAVNQFKQGYNCAQSVVSSFCEKLNLTKDSALKLATGFGGGMGRKQEVCGALTGSILVLSLLFGRGENDGKEKQDDTYAKVRNLIHQFEAKYGSINCKKLLNGCALSTPEGQEVFKSNNMIEKCYEYVENAVNFLEEIIEKNKGGSYQPVV